MKSLLFSVTALAAVAFTSSAGAVPVLTFGQTANGSTITATDDGTTTHIVGTNVAVDVSQFLGGGAPFAAVFNLDIISTGAVNSTIIGPATLLTQAYSGTESFYSGPGQTGTNYLTVTFTNFVFGLDGASSLTMAGSEPPGNVTFTSDVLDVLTLLVPRAIANSFADVSPVVHIDGTTLGAFDSSVSGVVSATEVPEPASMALFGLGLIGLGFVRKVVS